MGAPRKPFDDLRSKRKNQLVKELRDIAQKISGNDADKLIHAAGFQKPLFETESKEKRILANVRKFCDVMLKKSRGKGAAILANGLSLSEGQTITGVSQSSIAEGKIALQNERVPLRSSPPNKAPDVEREAFNHYLFQRAHVKSGTLKETCSKFQTTILQGRISAICSRRRISDPRLQHRSGLDQGTRNQAWEVRSISMPNLF